MYVLVYNYVCTTLTPQIKGMRSAIKQISCITLHQGNITMLSSLMMLPWKVVYLFFDLKQLLFDLKVLSLIYEWLFLHCFYIEACKVVLWV